MRHALASASIGILCAVLATGLLLPAPRASALTPLVATPPAGLSVEAKDDPFGKGFDFKFESDSGSRTTISLDPLGYTHSASGSLSSKSGSISLSAKYDRNKREIEITARRGGSDIGEFTWRVEAVLR
ncbi:MAG: hypothetical protein ACO3QC_01715 [Phycisphaerales bacterium]